MKIKLFSLLFFLMFSIFFTLLYYNNSKAQSYFPLKVGNKFVFNVNSSSWDSRDLNVKRSSYVIACYISKDTIINNKKYYYCNDLPFPGTWIRVDSITRSLYYYDQNNSCPYYYYENLIDSLGMDSCGHENSCISINATLFVIGNVSLFGYNTIYKLFNDNHYHYSVDKSYSSIFGLYYYHSNYYMSGHGVDIMRTLKGCIINGIKYGDTSTTDIKRISESVPNTYKLFQNYPNPFNCKTNIRYQIPRNDRVLIRVFNSLGNEVTTLVNENQLPGIYEIAFDGNLLPSGIYFCKLVANDFTETRKIALIK